MLFKRVLRVRVRARARVSLCTRLAEQQDDGKSVNMLLQIHLNFSLSTLYFSTFFPSICLIAISSVFYFFHVVLDRCTIILITFFLNIVYFSYYAIFHTTNNMNNLDSMIKSVLVSVALGGSLYTLWCYINQIKMKRKEKVKVYFI